MVSYKVCKVSRLLQQKNSTLRRSCLCASQTFLAKNELVKSLRVNELGFRVNLKLASVTIFSSFICIQCWKQRTHSQKYNIRQNLYLKQVHSLVVFCLLLWSPLFPTFRRHCLWMASLIKKSFCKSGIFGKIVLARIKRFRQILLQWWYAIIIMSWLSQVWNFWPFSSHFKKD